MNYILIITISFITWSWMSLYLQASSIRKGKKPLTLLKDKKLLDLLFKKTGLRLASIRISASEKLWGMMIGLPKYPYMILSQALYKKFNKDELEYVILHEMGHYILAHSAKLAVLYISFLTISSVLLSDISTLFIWGAVGVVVGLIMIQMSRIYEYEADAFALQRITNPKGMITATHQFEKAYKSFDAIRHDEDTLLGRLIYMGIPYNARVRSAQVEIKRRKQNVK